jgi:hypothetical protein
LRNLADNFTAPDTCQDNIVFAALVIENDDVLLWRHPQDAANLVGLVFTQQDLIAVKTIFRNEKSVHCSCLVVRCSYIAS